MAIKLGVTKEKVVVGANTGNVIVGAGTSATIPIYNGEYEVIPKVEEDITLATTGYAMSKDVVVKEVPFYEVKNSAGGTTFTIG